MQKFDKPKKFLLIPIPKAPYFRIGPIKWQDWYRQVKRTIAIARDLQHQGGEVEIVVLTRFAPKDKPSEMSFYLNAFKELASELNVRGYKETIDTVGQVERSFEMAREKSAELIFITAWMQYPRVRYLARGRKSKHYGAFGIPGPIFAVIDPFAMIFQPLVIFFGLDKFFDRLTASRRDKGAFW